jgi:hypothetical protein
VVGVSRRPRRGAGGASTSLERPRRLPRLLPHAARAAPARRAARPAGGHRRARAGRACLRRALLRVRGHVRGALPRRVGRVSADGGCLLQLGGRLSRTGSPVRALHLATLLAEAIRK